MKKIEILKTIGLIISITIIFCLIVYIFILKMFLKIDSDYRMLGLKIEDYDIEYCLIYDQDIFSQYKVYKIKNYSSKSMDEFRIQLENSNLWSREKFFEYIMIRFYDKEEGKSERKQIARDDLYYYHQNGVYAILDLKNAKLYYFENGLFNYHQNYSEILGIKTKDYLDREIYSVRGGPQNDGTDYYVYKFTDKKGEDIQDRVDKSLLWSKEKLNEDIIDCFEYNKEVSDIQNGYYHYKKVCRTSDEYKKYHFTDEEATGYEVGIYDTDKNILYYYWTSY